MFKKDFYTKHKNKISKISKKKSILKSTNHKINKKNCLSIILEESPLKESESTEKIEDSILELKEKENFFEGLDMLTVRKSGKHYRTCRFCMVIKV